MPTKPSATSALGRLMCDCHSWPQPIREAIKVTEREDNTREDWEDLHGVIEEYRKRRALRHVRAHVTPATPLSQEREK